MLHFFAAVFLSLVLLAFPAAAEDAKSVDAKPAATEEKKPLFSLYIPPEAAQAEETYDGLYKNLTKEQQDIIKAYESDYAKTADIELEISSTALKIKYCSENDTEIAKNLTKYKSHFNVYQNQLQARQRDERLKIRARQVEETTFLDPKILDGHFAYTSNVVFQVGFQMVKLNYEKGEFAKTDCAAVAKQLEEAALKGNPISGIIETAPDKVQEIQRLAKNGDAEGMFMLGMLQLTGNGVPKDPAQGVMTLKKSAEKGSQKAQLVLGVGMTTDMFGVPPDLQEARYWLEKAAAQGNAQAAAALEQLDKKK